MTTTPPLSSDASSAAETRPTSATSTPAPTTTTTPSHIFLLLTDSALPLGSFAFSSGLESYLAHTTPTSPRTALLKFLHLSLHTLSTSTLPFLYAAFATPHNAGRLDDELSASTACPVALRASTSQGRSLLTLYTKSLFPCASAEGAAWVAGYQEAIKRGEATGHFVVAWAVVCRAFGLGVGEAARVFTVGFVKSLVSAGVRLGVAGPYWSHGVLVDEEVVRGIEECVKRGEGRAVEDVGQGVPAWDLWQGRHEVLYSRVFNS